ncbi:MAG TPA: Tex family protein [Vicinamibacterales bacterium]|nr:Tex family protein [Vicinamibacterales bacterium]
METTVRRIAGELGIQEDQVEAVLRLLADGATSPFLARYRKEVTGGLDLPRLRAIEDRLHQVRELDERRAFILKSVGEQGKLTPALQTAVATADSRARLEDLYLPFRQKRKSRAFQARESGLEPLGDSLLANHDLVPAQEAERYVDPARGVPDRAAALDGARWILLERFSEDPALLETIRAYVTDHALLEARVIEGRQEKGARFAEFFGLSEPVRSIPGHRVLGILRGRKEGVLRVALVLPGAPPAQPPGEDVRAGDEGIAGEAAAAPRRPPETPREPPGVPEQVIAERFGIANEGRAAESWLLDTVRRAWKMKIFPYVQVEVEGQVRERAEREAIQSYARSLRDLLMAAPAGAVTVMGLDPGLRTGVKAAVVDAAGALLESAAVFPHQPRNEWDQACETLAGLIERHGVSLVAVGNGTGSRETDRLLSDIIKRRPELRFNKLIVSEAGVSSYGSSRLAARELPDLEAPLRAAVSVARRLQDPLRELAKVEPRTIGVGQYQHDVNQAHLSRALTAVVEDCAASVGVELETASSALLGRVPGITHRLADNIVAVRTTVGPFASREELRKVPGMTDRAFEQSAGFLRIPAGTQPLDRTRIHPESYPIVDDIAAAAGRPVPELIGSLDALDGLSPEQFGDERRGLPTVADIFEELRAPGGDPRPAFRLATFQEGLDDLSDLKPGMVLEGVVTNVATFGAFVDIGVHQDGLVHVSRLADRFVKDPHEVVKTGEVVRVKVLEVDLDRKRIALTMRFEKKAPGRPAAPRPQREVAQGQAAAGGRGGRRKPSPQAPPASRQPAAETAMAAAFSRLLKRS